MTCLSDEVLAAWAAGALAGAERDAAEGHAADCGACRSLAVAMAGITPRSSVRELGAEGATIGRYRITGSIGQGAMGVVLRGHDPMLDRELAIKMVNSIAATDEQRDRMLREAQMLARIDHPCVVRVYDAGLVGEEVFVAMEYVIGETLSRWLAETPRALDARLDVLTGAGRGIAAVHAKGLVHRDIKPDNILVRENGNAVVVDFGLARPPGTPGAAGSGIAGTPRYIAPEVRAGGAANAASDQLAWWTVVDDTLQDVELPAGHRRALDAAIARGRDPDPSRRYRSMTDAVAALTHACRSRARRRWIVAGALVAVAAIALAIMAWPRATDPCARTTPAAWLAAREPIRAHLAAIGVDAARVVAAIDQRAARTVTLGIEACRAAGSRGAAERAQGLRRQLCVDESWSDAAKLFAPLQHPEPNVARTALDELIAVLPVERCTGGAIPAVPAPPSAAIDLHARFLEGQLRSVRLAPDRNPAHRIAALQVLAPQIRALGYAPLEVTWHNDLAAAFAQTGNFVEARAHLSKTIEIAETSGDDDTRARALVNELMAATQVGTPPPASVERDAEATIARLGSPAITAQLRITQAMTRFQQGDLATALKLAREARTLIDSVALDAHNQQITIAQNLAGLEQATGDLAAAKQTYEWGYQTARRRFGDASPHTLQLRGARATNLMYAGDPAAARPELAAVADALERAVGDRDRTFVQARGYVCEADLAVEPAAARASCDRALSLFEATYGADSPQLAWPLTLVGQQRLAARAPAEAIAPLERAVAVTEHAAVSPVERPVAQAYLAIALHRARRDAPRAARLATDAAKLLGTDPAQQALMRELAELRPR